MILHMVRAADKHLQDYGGGMQAMLGSRGVVRKFLHMADEGGET